MLNKTSIMIKSNIRTIVKRGKHALITGSSSGIGRSCAFKFASMGYDLTICARRLDKLHQVKETILKINPKADISCVELDVSVERNISCLFEKIKQLDVLINNAGLVIGLEKLENTSSEAVQTMFQTNVYGAINMLKNTIRLMRQQNYGHIINIGSIAGLQPYKLGSIYCASKSSLQSITDSIRHELYDTNVKVSIVNPGMVNTEFSKVRFNNDINKANKVYEGMTPLTPDNVAEVVGFMASLPQNVVVADCTLFPTGQANATTVYRKINEQS